MLPDAFFTAEGLLQTAISVYDNFGVFEAMIDAELKRELPFLATSRLLTEAVIKGLGREEAHELIKRYAVESVLARRQGADRISFVDRLAADERFGVDQSSIKRCLADVDGFLGTAVTQVERVVARANAVIAQYPHAARADANIRV